MDAVINTQRKRPRPTLTYTLEQQQAAWAAGKLPEDPTPGQLDGIKKTVLTDLACKLAGGPVEGTKNDLLAYIRSIAELVKRVTKEEEDEFYARPAVRKELFYLKIEKELEGAESRYADALEGITDPQHFFASKIERLTKASVTVNVCRAWLGAESPEVTFESIQKSVERQVLRGARSAANFSTNPFSNMREAFELQFYADLTEWFEFPGFYF